MNNTNAQKQHDHNRSDQLEIIVIENVPALGKSAELTGVISLHNCHMDEVVKLKIKDEDRNEQSETSVSSFTEQTEELAGLAAQQNCTFTMHKQN